MACNPITRWTAKRKAEVINQIDLGLKSSDELCLEHGLTHEELAEWRRLYREHGTPGLRSTRLQIYRKR